MTKTISVNIGGYAFSLEECAYDILDKYLAGIAASYQGDADKDEIISDIEARIGELIKETKGDSGIVTPAMVELVKTRIGLPEEFKEESEGPCAKQQKLRKSLYRDVDNQNIGGVCSGLAAFFGIEVVWVRLIATAMMFGGLCFWDGKVGFGTFVAYVILWVCIPAARSVEQKCQMRGEPVRLEQFRDFVPSPAKKGPRHLSALGRVLLAGMAVMMLVIGGSLTIAGVAVPVVTAKIINSLIGAMPFGFPGGLTTWSLLVAKPVIWWIVALFVLSMGFGLCYGGLKILFGFKEPKWRPGLIVLLVWTASLIALIVFCCIKIFTISQFI